MRYPIFLFYDSEHLLVFDTPDQHWGYLEEESLKQISILLDSDGRELTARDGKDKVEIFDLGAEPDPDRLRSILIHALRSRGLDFRNDAPLESLVDAARSEWGYENIGVPIGEVLGGLLRFLHLRRRK